MLNVICVPVVIIANILFYSMLPSRLFFIFIIKTNRIPKATLINGGSTFNHTWTLGRGLYEGQMTYFEGRIACVQIYDYPLYAAQRKYARDLCKVKSKDVECYGRCSKNLYQQTIVNLRANDSSHHQLSSKTRDYSTRHSPRLA